MKNNQEISVRSVVLGESAVGKSSLAVTFAKGEFNEFQEPTIGAAFVVNSVTVNDKNVKFEIWDTAGQERYHCLAPMYYRGAQVAIIVYDITKQSTFERARFWVGEQQKHGSIDIVIALVGNKHDLEQQRAIATETAERYAEENELLFMETSAKTGHNVKELFLELAKRIESKNITTSRSRNTVSLDSSHNPTNRNRGCCSII